MNCGEVARHPASTRIRQSGYGTGTQRPGRSRSPVGSTILTINLVQVVSCVICSCRAAGGCGIRLQPPSMCCSKIGKILRSISGSEPVEMMRPISDQLPYLHLVA